MWSATRPASPGRSRSAGKGPIFRFALILGGLMALFNALFYLWIADATVFQTYLNLNARVCAVILSALGEDAAAAGKAISSPRFSLSIEVGCDAIQASAFFVFAVLASPSRLSTGARLRVLVLGTMFLLATNLARVVSLYYAGVYFPNAFEPMHIDVWQAVFIFLPLIMWFTLARPVAPDEAGSADACS